MPKLRKHAIVSGFMRNDLDEAVNRSPIVQIVSVNLREMSHQIQGDPEDFKVAHRPNCEITV